MILETLCSIGFLSGWLSACQPPAASVVGYVEGEYVQIAPIEVARIVALDVRRGDLVTAGETIGSVEATDAVIAVSNGEGALAQATAELANILYGRRPEEIAAIEASLDAAKLQTEDNLRSLDRTRDLNARGFAPQADLDRAQTAYDVASSRVKELTANLAVAKLPARDDEIAAARSRVKQAEAGLDQARWRLGQRTLTAPAAGQISDIVRRPGEVAGPTAPVVSMLPDGALKLTLYAPEGALSSLAVGEQLPVRCDGCPSGLTAVVSYIAREPEFTPPVIYSLDQRQTLVYLIEARPAHDLTLRLQPGQIVDVDLPQKRP
jgi:HlyD family secretion protein